jgi:hypothetical protein
VNSEENKIVIDLDVRGGRGDLMATNWDNIYQDYLSGKVHPALRSDNILPEFRILSNFSFGIKSRLILAVAGKPFKVSGRLRLYVSGIDSSSTACFKQTCSESKSKPCPGKYV